MNTFKPTAIPITYADDRQSAGAELTCPAVPPSDGFQTIKPRPPQNGPNATELSVNPLHHDIAAPSRTIIDAASSSIENSANDNWQKVHPRHTAKRKFQSHASPTYEQPNKFQTLDNAGDQEDIVIDEPQFQTVASGSTGRIPPFIISNPQFNWVEFRKKIKNAHPEEQFAGGENFGFSLTAKTSGCK
ncbi:hypothetical protein JTE90_028990 [Oedothorax gibbosus]|uniref:Uncharacterized protein n=1 Tax=Oedothorax gibbosus TaxID=931172 RepID=A0AAV6VGY9_9ARAC|nr:hypothetical protein JTE90_028990 [Oedothorax gibbosus]